jgi:hypothetical protein
MKTSSRANCFVERFISELGMIKKPVRKQNRQRIRSTTKPQWIPPPSDMTKVNVEATLIEYRKLLGSSNSQGWGGTLPRRVCSCPGRKL